MDLDEIIEQEPSEGVDFEYKGSKADPEDVAKEMVSLANSGGGILVYGVKYNDDQNEIEEIEGLGKPGKVKQHVLNHIRSKVLPDLKYEFNEFSYESKDVYVVEVAPAEPVIHSYEERTDVHIFYKREGESKVAMDALNVSEFYEKGRFPGTYGKTSSEESRKSNQFNLNHSTPESFPSRRFNKISETTPNCWLFYPELKFLPDLDYVAESEYERFDMEEIEGVAAAIKRIFGDRFANGCYIHGQQNASWIGRGLDNFVKTLRKRDKRYDTVPTDFELSRHHSESNIYLASTEEITIMLNGQLNSDGRKYLDHFYLSVSMSGVPFDNRKILELLDKTGMELKGGMQIEEDNKKSIFFDPGEINIEPISKVKISKFSKPMVDYVVAKNPFYKDKQLLSKYVGSGRFQSLTTQEKIFARVKTSHETDINPDYYLRWLELSKVGALGGNISAFNARAHVDHEYYR